ncbi:hypothetical protein N9R43_00130 [bacterium]|nr:hypothetical protein [bacterium]
MISSVLYKTNTSRYVYFDTDGQITSITGRPTEDDAMFAYFELSDMIPFIDGTTKFTDYTMKRSSNPLVYELVRRKVNLTQRNAENQITKIPEYGDGDIIIELKDDCIIFSASDALVIASNVDKNQTVIVAGTDEHPFFITHKDRPEFLISTQLIKFSDLLSGEKVTIKYDYKYNVSVYTRKYFDSYSLRRDTE